MNSTLAYLRGRRVWYVRHFAIWGSDSEAEFLVAVLETVGSDKRIGFSQIALGGSEQDVDFSSLIDQRGNALPGTISNPAVVILPREKTGAFVKSINGNGSFSVARADDSVQSVVVDLLIFETGA